ncbi:Hypothetical predicted protein [Cloeon dipterum]|uniref:C2H2-type domain-containing protein n=1 Tax=Cloeon dipterum TaxID=197152 RepID=A0A8S1C090_9INSE|nr:Hypothetical predicted protein [Cloeon dipterum]
MKSHLGKTTCTVCKKTFCTVSHLKKHMEMHSGRTKCNVCGKLFSNISTQCEDYSEDFAYNSAGQSENWQIVHSFSISNDQFWQSIVPKSSHPRRRVYTVFKPADNLTDSSYYVEADAEFTDDDEPMPAEYESLTNIEEIVWESGRPRRSASLNKFKDMQPVVDLGLRLSVNDNELNARDTKPQVAAALNGDAEFQRRSRPKSTWRVAQNDLTVKVERKKPGPKPKKGPIVENGAEDDVELIELDEEYVEGEYEDELDDEYGEEYETENAEYFAGYQGADNPGSLDENASHACEKCGKLYKSKTSLIHHYNVHLGKTTCPVCNQVFSRRPYMLNHVRQKHPQVDKPYE